MDKCMRCIWSPEMSFIRHWIEQHHFRSKKQKTEECRDEKHIYNYRAIALGNSKDGQNKRRCICWREKEIDRSKERSVCVFRCSVAHLSSHVYFTHGKECWIQSTVSYSLLKEPFSKHRFIYFVSLSFILFSLLFFCELNLWNTHNSTCTEITNPSSHVHFFPSSRMCLFSIVCFPISI